MNANRPVVTSNDAHFLARVDSVSCGRVAFAQLREVPAISGCMIIWADHGRSAHDVQSRRQTRWCVDACKQVALMSCHFYGLTADVQIPAGTDCMTMNV